MAQPAEPHDAYELGRHDERERMAQRCANRLGVPEYEWDSAESTAFAAGVEEGEADERERIIARLAAAAEQFDASGLPRPARWCQSMIETLTSERRDSRAAAMTRWGLADTDAPARQTPAIPDGTAPQPASGTPAPSRSRRPSGTSGTATRPLLPSWHRPAATPPPSSALSSPAAGRADMSRRQVPGTVYLLHFSRPYRHPRHYTGWASDLAARLADHDDGRGARLTAVAKAAGITWTLARTWPGTRARERQLTNQGGASRHCPTCKKERSTMTRPEPAATTLAFRDASRRIAALYASGAGLDQISAAHDDLAASLAADAQTPPGRAYAAQFADTGRSLIADLRVDEAVARGRSQAACTLPDGTPHPAPVLAAKGWQADRGIWQRTGTTGAARAPDGRHARWTPST
jgi:hypothetical protein